ncbi:MarR family winged helix-turn-helix transcriptional regulator [Aerococcus kribbianus]|uniref:MarR family transcriptional regulator n=1 Tax=Aerococcus kribbianus TaxID=2999064 RepID=A0A9X3FNA4_9LACT|nr:MULTISPECIES: MarR family transcriptional regulator [unclassified Aerococcus]MCZ0717645.1 MarR family transcriptional regulator [Aerococcus sp. YH-aer221]MCZ0725933.1 MarR family transcriptional regulator [Aerococcus sp. YH-aer222]
MTQDKTAQESLHALRVTLRANQYILDILKRDMRQYGLSENEFTVLELLYNRGPQAIQKIGQRILIPNSSLTYVIDRLEAKELAKREKNPDDRRIIMASITHLGREKMEAAFASHTQCIAAIFANLTSQERQNYISLMKKVGFKAQEIVEENKVKQKK